MGIATQSVADLRVQTRRPSPVESDASGLDIKVLYTRTEPALAALRTAADLARRLNGHITLIVPQIVPYPVPLASPPVLLEYSERRFRVLAAQARVNASVQIYLCRDPFEALTMVLAPRSLVVIGSRDGWWPTAEKRLARRLRRAGHQVIVSTTE